MNFNSHVLNTLFDKSLVRIIADFGSDKDPRSVISELTKELKTKVSNLDPGAYNFKLTRGEDGVYHLETPFMLYRDSRLILINLMKWIERNGKTERNDNLFLDLKFMDQVQGPFTHGLGHTHMVTGDELPRLSLRRSFPKSTPSSKQILHRRRKRLLDT